MLESVRIQNFRCLRDVTLELGPFTVFVGPNASGKSAIADALTIAEVQSPQDHWRCVEEAEPVWTLNSGKPIRLSQKLKPLNLNPLGKNRRKYAFVLADMRRLQEANEEWSLQSTGANLVNVFDTLSRSEQEKFVREFTRLVPMYSDVQSRAQRGKNRLQFQDHWHSDLWYEPEQVSDGTILTAAFVALGFQRYPPTLAVIEDPDHGLHPYLQRHVVEMLRSLSQGKLGNTPIQIVCTTHSQSFLNCLAPEEVRFIRRSHETGETEIQAAPVDNENWEKVYDQFQNSLGRMWMTGALGGVPGI